MEKHEFIHGKYIFIDLFVYLICLYFLLLIICLICLLLFIFDDYSFIHLFILYYLFIVSRKYAFLVRTLAASVLNM